MTEYCLTKKEREREGEGGGREREERRERKKEERKSENPAICETGRPLLSEIRHTEKVKYCMISLKCEVKKNFFLKQTHRKRDKMCGY